MKNPSKKYTIFDFLRDNRVSIQENGGRIHFDADTEILIIKQNGKPDKIIKGTDFPNRNLVPCYKVVNGKYTIDHYVDDTPLREKVPSISCENIMQVVTA